MYQNPDSRGSQVNQVMSNEQFNQVVEAIMSGKYSWACLLILRFAGYNPLHYIPYRTYNRLMKTNVEPEKKSSSYVDTQVSISAKRKLHHKLAHNIQDLNHLEEIGCQSTKVKGGKKNLLLGLFNRLAS